MQDEQQHDDEQDGPAYPGHGPVSDGPSPVVDDSDPTSAEVEPKYPITPGTESAEERAEIAEQRRAELTPPKSDDDGEDDDDEQDAEPVLPSKDSTISDEHPVQANSADPTL